MAVAVSDSSRTTLRSLFGSSSQGRAFPAPVCVCVAYSWLVRACGTGGAHRQMPRRSSSEPTLGEPGSVWVWRGGTIVAGKKHVEKPPKNEASAVAWRAIRKPTLHGVLGTSNKISSVIQFPCSVKDPFNMAQGSRGHLSAEDRRLLRVRVKHSLRHSPHYPEAVYDVERKLIEAFGKNPDLRAGFYNNEDFANLTLAQMVYAVDTNGGKDPDYDEPLDLGPAHGAIPKSHGYACGPQCYCLKFQDSALSVKVKEMPNDFHESFKKKTTMAASTLVDSLAASRRKRATATT